MIAPQKGMRVTYKPGFEYVAPDWERVMTWDGEITAVQVSGRFYVLYDGGGHWYDESDLTNFSEIEESR